MHILFISDMDVKYGAPQGLKQMVEGFRKYYPSIRISIIIPKGVRLKAEREKRAREFQTMGCAVFQVPYSAFWIPESASFWRKKTRRLIHAFRLIWGSQALISQVDMDQVDLIHSNSSREDLGAVLAEKYHKPLIWHIREFGDIDFSVVSLRKDYIDYMNQRATLLISMSNVIREHWIDKGIKAEKIKTIYDGVDENIVPKKEYNLDPHGIIRFVMLGSVREPKGQDRLIEALGVITKDNLNRLSIDIVGGYSDPDYLIQLQKRITELGLTHIVRFLGYQESFRKRLSEYDCGLMCSKSEAFGFVTVEYMAAGLPVIAAATGANPEIIRDGETGFLYEPGDPKNLAMKIETLIKQPQLCGLMGRKAAQYVKTSFSVKESVTRIYEEYCLMLS